MKLKSIIATTLAAMAISLSAQEKNEPFILARQGERVFDYCSIMQFRDDTFGLARAGEKIEKEDIHELKFGNKGPGCIECHTPQKERSIFEHEIINDKITGEYNILLVPIGYKDEEIPEKMEKWIDELEHMYQGINVDFSYLNHSIILDIKELGRFPYLSDKKKGDYVERTLKKKMDIGKCVFIYKSNNARGGRGHHLLVTGGESLTSWIIGHELGHHLGLNDGYKQYYGERRINGTEFFVNYNKLPGDVKKAVTDLQSPYEKMPNVTCKGKPIYRFYPEVDDIMEARPSLEETQKRIENNEPFFNPMQRYIMRENIRERLEPSIFDWFANKF